MPIRWTNAALVAAAEMTGPEREALLQRLDLVAEFPEMNPGRQRGLYVGARYFPVRKRWIVFYRPRSEDVLILNILAARARSV